MARLLLWDIDGTLLTASSVNRDALYAATSSVLGREFAPIELKTAGKTDPEIATELLSGLGIDPNDLPGVLKKVLRRFGPELAARRHDIVQKGELFKGVRELLASIDNTRAINTVLTGNIAVNAICKLDAFRLTRYFDLEIGGFGSDRSVRAELVEVVLGRAAEKRNKYFNDDEIWIIGDTPLDFAVAQANHTRCLLVATGRHSFDELDTLGPDVTVDDLTDTQALMELLTEPIVH